MNFNLPLQGVRVHLAGSIPESATPSQANGIKSFVQKFTSALLQEGGTLIHGSHPTFIESLKSAALPFVGANGRKDALTLVRSHKYSHTQEQLSLIAQQREYSAVHVIPSAPGNDNESLVPMREWMAERSDVVVAIGGKWYEVNKSRAGVPGELEEALKRGRPGFVVASFGGAMKGYITDDITVLDRLHNGLSRECNESISSCDDVDQIVSRILSQLKLLPLIRNSYSTGRLFRILALDGGGIRGAFTAAVLAKWADMLGEQGEDNLAKHFDLVAGTSTGAILAIGLGIGISPKSILNFYKSEGPRIFPKDRKLRHWLKSKHDSRTLRETLETIFADRRLSTDSQCRLVIPTVRATHGQSEVIVTPHCHDRTAYQSISAVEAALASSACPSYFDEAEIDDGIASYSFLDGGIWANNPVLPALAEACHHLNVPIDRIDVLSVGTTGYEANFTKALGGGKVRWAFDTADLFISAQEHAASVIADNLLTRARHLRVNQITPSEIKLDDTEALEDLAYRGAIVGESSFEFVRSRFLDGFHAQDWRKSNHE